MSKKSANLLMLMAGVLFFFCSKTVKAAEFNTLSAMQQKGVCLQIFEDKANLKFTMLLSSGNPSDETVVNTTQVIQVYGYFRQLFVAERVPADDLLLAKLWLNSQVIADVPELEERCLTEAKRMNGQLEGSGRKHLQEEARAWVLSVISDAENSLKSGSSDGSDVPQVSPPSSHQL